eukprot:2801563-Amphidinium_carterae.1
MLSGLSTIVTAWPSDSITDVQMAFSRRLHLNGIFCEVVYGAEVIAYHHGSVQHWPGIKPMGEISEFVAVMREAPVFLDL